MAYGDKMRAEGWKNTYGQKPEKPGMYLVEDHNHNRFTAEFAINEFKVPVWIDNRGYDICWWKEKEHHGEKRVRGNRKKSR